MTISESTKGRSCIAWLIVVGAWQFLFFVRHAGCAPYAGTWVHGMSASCQRQGSPQLLHVGSVCGLQEREQAKATHVIGGFGHKVFSLCYVSSFDEVRSVLQSSTKQF